MPFHHHLLLSVPTRGQVGAPARGHSGVDEDKPEVRRPLSKPDVSIGFVELTNAKNYPLVITDEANVVMGSETNDTHKISLTCETDETGQEIVCDSGDVRAWSAKA
jgi:hypothetical protein